MRTTPVLLLTQTLTFLFPDIGAEPASAMPAAINDNATSVRTNFDRFIAAVLPHLFGPGGKRLSPSRVTVSGAAPARPPSFEGLDVTITLLRGAGTAAPITLLRHLGQSAAR